MSRFTHVTSRSWRPWQTILNNKLYLCISLTQYRMTTIDRSPFHRDAMWYDAAFTHNMFGHRLSSYPFNWVSSTFRWLPFYHGVSSGEFSRGRLGHFAHEINRNSKLLAHLLSADWYNDNWWNIDCVSQPGIYVNKVLWLNFFPRWQPSYFDSNFT